MKTINLDGYSASTPNSLFLHLGTCDSYGIEQLQIITGPANAMEGLPPPRNQVPLYIQQTVANGVTIDWGDGTPTETLPGVAAVTTTHTYAQAGDYVISLDPVEECTLGLGTENQYNCVMGSTANNNAVYRNMLSKIITGKNYGSVGRYVVSDCYNLSSFIISESATTVNDYAFNDCYGISSIVIPTQSIRDYAFYRCHSLSSVVVTENVKSIGKSAFYQCLGMKEYHFLSSNPPTLSGSIAFSGIPSDCIIYVPVGSLQAYQTATNWAVYADQIQEEPV